jgi:predicted RNA-binding protein with RPS1 domain
MDITVLEKKEKKVTIARAPSLDEVLKKIENKKLVMVYLPKINRQTNLQQIPFADANSYVEKMRLVVFILQSDNKNNLIYLSQEYSQDYYENIIKQLKTHDFIEQIIDKKQQIKLSIKELPDPQQHKTRLVKKRKHNESLSKQTSEKKKKNITKLNSYDTITKYLIIVGTVVTFAGAFYRQCKKGKRFNFS